MVPILQGQMRETHTFQYHSQLALITHMPWESTWLHAKTYYYYDHTWNITTASAGYNEANDTVQVSYIIHNYI